MGRKPGAAPSLTRDQIAEKALELADESGIESVSVRRLATALDKTPMAVYTYFRSIQEIRAAAAELAFREVDTRSIPGERWDDTLRRCAASVRRMFLHHPSAGLHKIMLSDSSNSLITYTSDVFALHSAQGIPPAILNDLWCVVAAFLGGFIPGELAELEAQHAQDEPDDRTWLETAGTVYCETTFNEGLEVIIAGIRAIAAPDPCEWHTPEA